MPKIMLRGTLTVPSADLDAVLQALPEHMDATRAETGCLEFNVMQRTDEPSIFDVYEVYSERNALDRHQMRLKQTAWAEASRNAERDYCVSEVD